MCSAQLGQHLLLVGAVARGELRGRLVADRLRERLDRVVDRDLERLGDDLVAGVLEQLLLAARAAAQQVERALGEHERLADGGGERRRRRRRRRRGRARSRGSGARPPARAPGSRSGGAPATCGSEPRGVIAMCALQVGDQRLLGGMRLLEVLEQEGLLCLKACSSPNRAMAGANVGYRRRVPPAKRLEVEIGDRRLSLSNLDKVLYPEAGFTKGQVIDYYTRIAPAVLPHLRDRPLTLKRYPNGVDQPYFYEKQSPSHRPDWVQTAGGVEPAQLAHDRLHCLCNDLPTLVWLANLADLELHTSLALDRRRQGADADRLRPRPGPAGHDRRVRRGGAAAARGVRAPRPRGVPEDVGLEGHAGLRAAQHADHLRRHEDVRARARAGARAPPSRARRSRT